MKYAKIIGSLLIIIGVILVVYKILMEENNFELTKSIGFIMFVLGILLYGIDRISTKNNSGKMKKL